MSAPTEVQAIRSIVKRWSTDMTSDLRFILTLQARDLLGRKLRYFKWAERRRIASEGRVEASAQRAAERSQADMPYMRVA